MPHLPWGDYLREVGSAPLKFWALEPHFMWDWYVNMSKIVSAVPWNCQHGAKNLACHGDFLSMCKWGFTDWFWKVPSRGGEWSIKIFNSSQNLPLLDLLAKFKWLLACSSSPNFAVARMLAFLSVLLDILWIFRWIKVKVILYGA